jgi:hypothetical protein
MNVQATPSPTRSLQAYLNGIASSSLFGEEAQVRHVVDSVLITIIGQVNRFVFVLTGGRVVLYRSFGFPGKLLNIVGPQDGAAGRALVVSCLPDADDYIIMVREQEDASLYKALDACVAASVEFGNDWVPVDVTMLSDQRDRSVLLNRLLRKVSISERHQIVRHCMVPIARIHLQTSHVNDVSIAISEIRSS